MAYAPATNLTSTGTIAHLASVFYKQDALDVLRQMNRFMGACEPDDLPKRNGKTVQWYRYSTLAANTTPSTEGAVGTGLAMTTGTVSASVSQYSDFASISTLLQDTAIDDIVSNSAKELAYRASITVDTLARTEFDSNSASTHISTAGSYFSTDDVRSGVARLKAINVRPKDDGNFYGVIHPYVTYDLISDNTAGGFIDVMKYANPQMVAADGQSSPVGEVGKVAGVRFYESTNVGSTGSAPNVQYYTYIVGKGAVGHVPLAGNAPSDIVDPSKQNFQINYSKGGPSGFDPEGNIGAFVAYRFVTVFKTLDSTNYRYRAFKADASLV